MTDITIKDIRAKYPQYSDLSDQQLADALHAKHYSDMPKADFYGRIGFQTGGFEGTEGITQGVSPPGPRRVAPQMPQMAAPAPGGPSMANAPVQPQDTAAGLVELLQGATPPAPAYRAGIGAMMRPQMPMEGTAPYGAAVQAAQAPAPQVGNYRPDVPFDPRALPQPTQMPQQAPRPDRPPLNLPPDQSSLGGDLQVAWEMLQGMPASIRAGQGLRRMNATAGAEPGSAAGSIFQGGAEVFAEAAPQIAGMNARISEIPMNPAAAAVQGAETFGDAMQAFKADPLGVMRTFGARSIGASAPALAGAVVGQLLGGPVGAAVLAGGGGFTSESSLVVADEVSRVMFEAGIDMTNPEAVQEFILGNPEAFGGVLEKAMIRAGIISATDAASAGLAGIVARSAANAGRPVRIGATAGTALGIEAPAEGAGEAMAQLATEGEIAPGDVMAEVIGGTAMGVPQAAGQIAVEAARSAPQPEAPEGTGPSRFQLTPRPDQPQAPEGDAPVEGTAAPDQPAAPEAPALPATDEAPAPLAPGTAPAPPEAGRFELIDEGDTVGGEARLTGRKVRVDLDTGDLSPVEEAVSAAPVVERQPPSDGGGVGAEPDTAAGATNASEDPPEMPATDPEPGRRPEPVYTRLDNETTQRIKTDPQTFQYKDGGDTEGVTDVLRGVKEFDPKRAGQVILYERENGDLVVADGHQRTGLARRAAEAGQENVGGMAALIYREADGYSPQEVMTEAALSNIGQGSGTAIDAARIFRNMPGKTLEDLNLPKQADSVARRGMDLSRLSDGAFGMVANGVASERDGGIVGRVVADAEAQADVLDLLTKMKLPNAFQAESVARQAAEATRGETQTDMFGAIEVKKSLYRERAKILDGAIKMLRRDKQTFDTLLKRGDAISAEGGNVLDQDANEARAQGDAVVLQYLGAEANRKGPISDALNQAAEALAGGQKPTASIEQFVEAVRRADQRGGETSEAQRPDESGGDAEGRGGEVDPATRRAPASWVIREKATGDVVMETTDRRKVEALNTANFEAVPIGQHLGELNASPKPATERTEAGDQSVMPGMEQDAARSDAARKPDQKREIEARAQQSKKRTATPQEAPGGMFDDQGDMLDSIDQQHAEDSGLTVSRDQADQVPRYPSLPGARHVTPEVASKALPKLRAELDRLNLGRVRVALDKSGRNRQGAFEVSRFGAMDILIGQSLDVDKTMYHEAIHAMRHLDMFSAEEWSTLSRAAEKKWLEQYDIATRYPHLMRDERIEEAIAEAFADAAAAKKRPANDFIARAFSKIIRLMRAIRTAFNGLDADEVFMRAFAGEIGARDAATTGFVMDVRRAQGGPGEYETDLLRPIGESKMIGPEKTLIDEPDLKAAEAMHGGPGNGRSIRYIRYEGGNPVGVLQFATKGPRTKKAVIQNVYVRTDRRRQKIAAGLLRRAQADFDVKHSNDLTNDGRLFKSADGSKYQSPQRTRTDTPEFKKWFGDSKVVDEDGAPLVVYHGTGADFEAFDSDADPQNYEEDRGVFHFTSSYGTAEAYSEFSGPFGEIENEKPRVISAYLSIENPMEHHATSGSTAIEEWDNDALLKKFALRGGHDGIIIRADDGQSLFIAFRPEQIKSVFNRGGWDANDARILEQAQPAPKGPGPLLGSPHIPDRRVWDELTAANRSIWGRVKGAKDAAHDAADRARMRIQDRMLPLLRAQQAIEQYAGAKLPDELSAYQSEVTFSGKAGQHLDVIDRDFTKPILDVLAENKDLSVDMVGDWLTAMHAEERNKRIASINKEKPDGGSGMTTAEARKILREMRAGPHRAALEEISGRLADLRKRTLDLRVEAGLMSKADADALRAMYKHYVPLKGFAETDHAEASLDSTGMGRRYSIRGREDQVAMGRGSRSFNPLMTAIVQAQEVSIRAEKNRVAQAVYQLAEQYPSDALWTIKPVKQKRYFNKTTGMVETRAEGPITPKLDDNEMAVKVDGVEKRILFHDERITRAIGQVGADQMSVPIQIAATFNRFLSMMITTLDPEFVIRNAFRDITAASINITEAGGDDANAIRKGMVKNWRKAFSGAFGGMGGKESTEWQKHYKEFVEAGAKVHFFHMENPEATAKDFEKRLSMARSPRAIRALRIVTNPKNLLSDKYNPVLGFVERTNLAVDNAVRLAAFVEARKLGWSKQKAANLAKDLTVNFNRRGSETSWLNALYLFFNAAVQGLQVTAKAMASKKGLAIGGSMVLAGTTMDFVNAWLSPDDDDGELAYDKVPDYKNRMNLIFMVRNGGQDAVAIPMPYIYAVFPYMGQQIGKVMRGVKTPTEALGGVFLASLEQTAPIQVGDFSEGSEQGFRSILPTAMQPVFEVSANLDWLGRRIRPENPYGDYGPNAYKHYSGVSDTSRWIADALNRGTGGTMAEAGALDVSPEYIDHVAGFLTGGAGRFVGRNVDLAIKLATGEPVESRNVPMARQLIYDTGDWIDRDRYYRFREEVRTSLAAVKDAADAGISVSAEAKRLTRLEGAMKEAEKLLRATRKAKRQIDAADTLTAREKAKRRELIYDREALIFLAFNKKYLNVMGPQGE